MIPLSKSRKKGLIIILSAPSGTGKTTISNEIVRLLPGIKHVVTTTTRPPRKGEVDGVNYFFVSESEFKRRIEKEEFFEWAKVHGDYYGTPRKFIEESVKNGIDVLLTIDVQGGLSFKKEKPDSVLIFIAPPSEDVMKQRLYGRGTEDEKAMKKRIKTAEMEMTHIKDYDYWVVNDVLEKAVDEIKSVVIAERRKVKRFPPGRKRS